MARIRSPLARRRIAVGHSQESLAGVLGVDRSTVARWERGATVPQPWVRAPLARALSLTTDSLVPLLPSAEHVDQRRGADEHHTGLHNTGNHEPQRDWLDSGVTALRSLLARYDVPVDGPVRSLPDLRRAVATVVAWRLNSEYQRIAECLPTLIPELTRALLSRPDEDRTVAATLLVQVYRAADAIADKFGFPDLSARTIQVIEWAAQHSGDQVTLATSSYVRTETFFTTGELAVGREMLERAADRLTVDDSADGSAAYGALHMRAAVVAARAGAAARAQDHLREAELAARRVPDGVYTGTAFGPSSVRIHQVTLALDLDELGTVFAAAAGWVPPDSVPVERRAHFYTDLARAQKAAGRTEAARQALHTAITLAPTHVTAKPWVRTLLAPEPGQQRGLTSR